MHQARLQAEAELAEARTRESDLLYEVDKLRAENRALEARAAQQAASALKATAAARGGDKEEMKKLEGAVKRVEDLLSKERKERSEEMRTTQRKLDWYAENQASLVRREGDVGISEGRRESTRRGYVQRMPVKPC